MESVQYMLLFDQLIHNVLLECGTSLNQVLLQLCPNLVLNVM